MTKLTKEQQAARYVRLAEVNQLIIAISESGRKFFRNKADDFVSSMYLKNNVVYFIDYYTKKHIRTDRDRFEGFTSGGTLERLVRSFADYILNDCKLPLYAIGMYRSDSTNIWGYDPEALEQLRNKVRTLPIFKVEE